MTYYADFFRSYNLNVRNEEPTRITPTSNTLIDYVVVNDLLKMTDQVSTVVTTSVSFSDRSCLTYSIQKMKPKNKLISKKIVSRPINDKNKLVFVNDLCGFHNTHSNVNDSMSHFLSYINKSITSSFPERTFTKRGLQLSALSWYTSKAKNLDSKTIKAKHAANLSANQHYGKGWYGLFSLHF